MSTQPPTSQASCPTHPKRAATGVCDRCGSYCCDECVRRLADRNLCSQCLAKPGVDYLAETRQRFTGRRDGWVWYFGAFGGFAQLISLGSAVTAQDVVGALIAAVLLGVSAAYLALWPWARDALWAYGPLTFFNVFRNSDTEFPWVLAVTGVAIFLFLLAPRLSVRNKLAFDVPVSDEALQKYYDRYLSNPLAGRSLVYGLLSLLVPLLGIVTLAMGVRAYRRSDPDAWPPARGRVTAVMGIGISCLSLLLWLGVAASAAFSQLQG